MLFTALIELTGWTDGSFVYQIEAQDLDQMMGRLKYLLIQEHGYQERGEEPLTDELEEFPILGEDPIKLEHFTNIWRAALLDANDQFYLVNIVRTSH